MEHGQGGVAIIWRKHLKVQRLSVGDDRVVAIKIRTKNENFVFCSVYLLSTNSSMSEFMNTVKCLEDMCVNFNYRQEKIILAGDFNAQVPSIHVPVSWKTIEEKLFLYVYSTCVFNLVVPMQQMSICPVKDHCLHMFRVVKKVLWITSV